MLEVVFEVSIPQRLFEVNLESKEILNWVKHCSSECIYEFLAPYVQFIFVNRAITVNIWCKDKNLLEKLKLVPIS